MLSPFRTLCHLLILLCFGPSLFAQRQMENLTRGIVAVRQPEGSVFVSWRLFGTDPDNIAFNLYRFTSNAAPVKVNDRPITNSTHCIDLNADTNQVSTYFVRAVLDRKELAPSKSVPVWEKGYLEILIKPIDGYRPGDASIADLDGDG